ncbi:MAG: putative TonB-dependent receptor [Ferruginibacter sp.]|uniref:TonB-dependent receptor n=1 Tax=Ferruginibacter sp. TaxID=1940288 RepID=UPI002659F489|nr:TonB-dependent receptor [Ferruginibacter sp.]MDB5277639.1 putative TonB-dependent receptor [Ferruginibacter sp.]
MTKKIFIAVTAILCNTQLMAQQDTVNKATYLPEVIVTGVQTATDKQKFPMPVGILNQKDWLQNSATNIIDAMSAIPGVSLINIGPAIAKPVVRGLGYNRVVVMNDGIRQEGQQWGDEFGIEIDEYTVQRAEVLKGPGSLRYGSDAMAGVINLLPQSFSSEGETAGRFLTNYQSNNGLIAGNLFLGGNQKGFVWNVNYTYKTAHDYKNKYDGYVWNSNYGESNLKGMFGVQKKWGFSTVTLSSFNLKTGIIEGARDEVTGAFTKSILNFDGTSDSAAVATKDEMLKYNQYNIIHQHVRHYKAVWDNSIALGSGKLGLKIGYQQNHRQEANDIVLGDVYNFDFLQQTLNYDVSYEVAEINNWKVSFGANGMAQSFKNKGTAFLFPEYHSFDFGLYSLAQKTIDKLTLSGGLRFDTRHFKGDDLYVGPDGERLTGPAADATQQFTAYRSNFSGVSGSIGAAYDFSKLLYGKLNIARGYRAPNVAESGSNGIHDGTPFYEIGDSKLKPENSLQLDGTIGLHAADFTAEATLFINSINNYIFPLKLASTVGGDSLREGAPTFKFVAGDAILKGGEIIAHFHPQQLKWLRWENAFSFISAIQKNQGDSSKYLPYTPPGKLQTKFVFSFTNNEKCIRDVFVSVGIDHYFEQNKVFYKFNNETITPAYTLLNIGAGASFYTKKKQFVSIYFLANNLADVAYLSNMSRLKYADINNATGRTGVYNMGRNFSIKLSFPINFL